MESSPAGKSRPSDRRERRVVSVAALMAWLLGTILACPAVFAGSYLHERFRGHLLQPISPVQQVNAAESHAGILLAGISVALGGSLFLFAVRHPKIDFWSSIVPLFKALAEGGAAALPIQWGLHIVLHRHSPKSAFWTVPSPHQMAAEFVTMLGTALAFYTAAAVLEYAASRWRPPAAQPVSAVAGAGATRSERPAR
jgi:hypothetical protein